MEIRQVEESDIRWIVDLHRQVLPNDLLPRFGRKFMRELYNQLLYQADVEFLCFDGGFGIFVLDRRWLEKIIFTKKFWSMFKTTLIRPNIIPHVVNYLSGYDIKFLKDVGIGPISDFELWQTKSDHMSEIAFIAIHPLCQGEGWGKKLIEDGTRKKDIWVAKTLKPEVRFFYQRLGFKWIGTEQRRKIPYYVLYRNDKC